MIALLNQGLANFSYKGPDSKYFRLWRLYSLVVTIQQHYRSLKAAIDNMQMNMEHVYVPIELIYINRLG